MFSNEVMNSLLNQSEEALAAFICASKINVNDYADMGTKIFLKTYAAAPCKTHNIIHIYEIEEAGDVARKTSNLAHHHITRLYGDNMLTLNESKEARAFIANFIQNKLLSVINSGKINLRDAREIFRDAHPELAEVAAEIYKNQRKVNRLKHLDNLERNNKISSKKAIPLKKEVELPIPRFVFITESGKKNRVSRFQDKQGLSRGSAIISHLDIDSENLLEFYTCFRKASYAFKQGAQESILSNHKKEIELMSIYSCVYCTGYHVGHNSNGNISRVLKNARSHWKSHPSDANKFIHLKKLLPYK